MNTIDYCELLKKEKNLKSTYALAKYLEVSQTTAKQWMKADIGFSDETALLVAKKLNLPAEKVLLDINIQRSKSENVKDVWKGIASSLPTLLFIPSTIVYILCKIFCTSWNKVTLSNTSYI